MALGKPVITFALKETMGPATCSTSRVPTRETSPLRLSSWRTIPSSRGGGSPRHRARRERSGGHAGPQSLANLRRTLPGTDRMGDRLRVGMIGPGLMSPGHDRRPPPGSAAAPLTAWTWTTLRPWARAPSLRSWERTSWDSPDSSDLATGYRPDIFHIHVADRRSFYRKLAYFEAC